MIDSSEHKIFVSTSHDQRESFSEASIRVDQKNNPESSIRVDQKNNSASVLTESHLIKAIPEKLSSTFEKNLENRLSKSPIEFSASEVQPLTSPRSAQPVSSPRPKPDDPDARSSPSYSNEFEEEDQDYVQVNFQSETKIEF